MVPTPSQPRSQGAIVEPAREAYQRDMGYFHIALVHVGE
jgi:hypothetical protein